MAIIFHVMNLQKAWEAVTDHLKLAEKQPGHPFRYLSLATVTKISGPKQRTVVLREFIGQKEFVIFTDSRSAKVEEIRNNPSVSLLFYDADEKLQVSVQGMASIVSEENEKLEYWNAFASDSAHAYTSKKNPGTEIHSPEEAYDWNPDNPEYFCVIKVQATQMEFLQLSGKRHLRSSCVFEQNSVHRKWMAP